MLACTLVLLSVSTLVLSGPAAATGSGDGLEPDSLDSGLYIEPELGASDDSEQPTEPLPTQPATDDGSAPGDGVDNNETGAAPADEDGNKGTEDGNDGTAPDGAGAVDTNETRTPAGDDFPEDAKPQQTVCGTAPTALQHQPGSCASPFDAPPNIEPVCSWKLVEIVTYVWTPPVIRWVPKVVGWTYKLVKGVEKKFPITQKVAEEVEGEAWEPVSKSVQQWWCPS